MNRTNTNLFYNDKHCSYRSLTHYLPLFAVSALFFQCSSTTEEPQQIERVPHIAAGIVGAPTFGVAASNSFQSPQLSDLPNAWDNAWGFWDGGNTFLNGKWAYNLVGGKAWWEQPSNYSDNVNSVDFFFGATHGGAWVPSQGNPARGAYSMWENGSNAFTNNMRLTNTSGFFTYACETHKNDGYLATRWAPVFRGGLKIATGSFHTLMDSWFNDDSGNDFVYDLASNWTIEGAWFDGVWDLWVAQYPSVMASGTSAADCSNRLYGMTVQNIFSSAYPKLVDDNVVNLCWHAEGI